MKIQTHPALPVGVLAVSVGDAATSIGVCRSLLYEAMRRGELRFRKLGRRRLVLVADLTSFVENLPNG
ncbi:MAG: helix-turn-helix domain-containing protein [Alphaproteobacteria bacterium]